MNPTLLDLLLQQQRRQQNSGGESFTADIPDYQFQGGRNPGADVQYDRPKPAFYDVMAPAAFQNIPSPAADGMLSGSKMGAIVGQRPQLFDLNAGMVAGAPPARFTDPQPNLPEVPADLAKFGTFEQQLGAGDARANGAANGWSNSKLAEYYGSNAGTPWSWKPSEVTAPVPAMPIPAPAAPIPGATPTFREQYYDASGALKPEYDSAKRYGYTTTGGNYVGRQYSDGTPYDPIASARQRALTDPRVQALMAERELENKGRLDAILAQDKGIARGKDSDGIALMASQAVAGITDPVQKMEMYGKILQLGKLQQAQNNSELGSAGIRVPGMPRAGGAASNPLVNPAPYQTPQSLEASLNADVASDYEKKNLTDRIGKYLLTPSSVNAKGEIVPGSPIGKADLKPEVANNLADIINSARTPEQKQAVINEILRLTPDKNALGDALVRASVGHASLLGLQPMEKSGLFGLATRAQYPDQPWQVIQNNAVGLSALSRGLSAMGGKADALFNQAVLKPLPGQTNGRIVPIDQGDTYGIRNKILGSDNERQGSKQRLDAARHLLEVLMGKGYYGKGD
jgi:hypothetical protein